MLRPSVLTTSAAHSVFSASSSSRWLYCHGSASMILEADPEPINPAAELGTSAHLLGEFCIKWGVDTYDCLGLIFNSIAVTQETADAVQVYVGYIRALCTQYGVNPLIEQRVSMISIGEYVYGTADCIFIIGDLIIVVDYKNGFEIVDVVGNSQALFYIVATLDTYNLWGVVKKAVSVIVQPRKEHVDGPIRTAEYDINTLYSVQHNFKRVINKALQPEPPLQAGSWCKYCPAKGNCYPRIMRTFSKASCDKPLNRMSVKQIEAAFLEVPAMRRHLEAIEAQALKLAREGVNISGHKVVKSIVRASCTDENAFVKEAMGNGVNKGDLFNSKLISMTSAKKLVDHDIVNRFFIKPPTTTTLVKLSDKRPALSMSTVKAQRPSAKGIFSKLKGNN